MQKIKSKDKSHRVSVSITGMNSLNLKQNKKKPTLTLICHITVVLIIFFASNGGS